MTVEQQPSAAVLSAFIEEQQSSSDRENPFLDDRLRAFAGMIAARLPDGPCTPGQYKIAMDQAAEACEVAGTGDNASEVPEVLRDCGPIYHELLPIVGLELARLAFDHKGVFFRGVLEACKGDETSSGEQLRELYESPPFEGTA